jgi:long-chain acyl-CoA synthetase
MSQLSFYRFAEQNPDALALVDPDGREWTRGELWRASNRVARGLHALGLRDGDVLSCVLPNSAEVLQLYLAAFQTGLYLTPINHHLTGPEIAYIVRDSGSKLFVGAERFAAACREAAKELALPAECLLARGPVDGFRAFEELGAGQSEEPPPERKAGSVMNYTSGTTGHPKGVRRPLAPIDPDTAATLMTGFFRMFGLEPEDGNVHICGSPLYHTAVLVFASTSLHMGHAVVLMDKWTPEGMLERIERYRVTTSHMVPTQFHRLLSLPENVRARYDVSSLRCMVHAAAPCPVETKRAMLDWWGDSIYEYYAATEGGGTLVTPKEWRERPGTVGRAWPGAEVKIFDDEGNELGPGRIGTVYMRLGQARFEYKDDAEKTRKSRLGEFFTVGDVGELDEAGYLFLRDRKADMIISGGVNIYPAEIEAVLHQHPQVADVAVFGIPHEDWGEEVKAVVEPEPGAEAGDALAREILAWCEGRLARYKTPRSIDFVEAMPRDPNGKLYKRKLRDPHWAGRDRAI